jgi:hypothetical protein
MSLAIGGGVIIPTRMPDRLKDIPVAEYLNFVGKLSETTGEIKDVIVDGTAELSPRKKLER